MSATKGRKVPNKPSLIPDVRTLECPQTGQLHQLVNNDLATHCLTCGTAWAELDAQARANLTPTATGTKTCIDCGATLVSDRRWAEAASEIRQQWREEGKASRVGDRCARCSRKGKAA